jgi:hypothetical protein
LTLTLSFSLPLASRRTGHNFHCPCTLIFLRTLIRVLDLALASECDIAAIVRP